MMKLKYALVGGLLLAGVAGHAEKIQKLKPAEKYVLNIPESSDVALSADGHSLYIVSDHGHFYQTDLQGKIIRKAPYNGFDSEGIYADKDHVYVVEEFTRDVKVFNVHTLQLERSVPVPYSGARNKAYEGLVYNPVRQKMVLVIEQNPSCLVELDDQLHVYNRMDKSSIARDLSAITFYKNSIWLLSDEDRTVFQLDPETYEVQNKWQIPVLNPEGIAFGPDGRLIIVSDAMHTLYYFTIPELEK